MYALPDLGEQSLASYAGGAYPVVSEGQQAAAGLASRYVGLLAKVRPASPGRIGAALEQSGVLVTPEHGSFFAPIIRARETLAEGGSLVEAMTAGADRATTLSSIQLLDAQRVGLEEGADATGRAVQGYRSVPY
jgi:hypothetical protein